MSQEKKGKSSNSKKVLALAVVCVILTASLVAVVATLQAQITEKGETIDSLNEQIATLQLQISQTTNNSILLQNLAYLSNKVNELSEELSEANAAIETYQSIISLSSATLFYNGSITQDANSVTTLELYYDVIMYAGYIVVEVEASANTTFAQALFSFSETDFDFSETVGESGSAIFPVLPGFLEVRIGNLMETGANNATVRVMYYY
jgi:TolA-binding protein